MNVTSGAAGKRPADRRPARPDGLGQLSKVPTGRVLVALSYHLSDKLGRTGTPLLEAKDHKGRAVA